MPLIDALENCSINDINKSYSNSNKTLKMVENLKTFDILLDKNCCVYKNKNISKNNNSDVMSCYLDNFKLKQPSSMGFDFTEKKKIILIQLKILFDLIPSFGNELNVLGFTIVSGGINHQNTYVSVESIRKNSPADYANLKVNKIKL